MKTLRNLGQNPRLAVVYLLASGLLAGGLAACSGSGSEAVAPTVELTSSAPTTIATTTTSTTEPTTTTLDPNIAAVEAVYLDFHEALLPEGEMVSEPWLEEYAAGELLINMMASSNAWIAEGATVGENSYEVHLLEVVIDGQTARARSCDLDAISILDAAGEVKIPADTERYYRVADFELVDGVWKMTRRELEGGVGVVCEVA